MKYKVAHKNISSGKAKPTMRITFPFQCHKISPISLNVYQNQLAKEIPGEIKNRE